MASTRSAWKQAGWQLMLLVLWQLHALGQAPGWQLSASQQVIRMGDELRITYQLQQQSADDFEAPRFDDWQVLEAPPAAGRQRQTFGYVLRPLHAGSCVVPAARVKLNGTWYESNRLVIEVLDNNATQAAAGEFLFDAYVLGSGENPQEKINRNLFIRPVLSKTRCYEGETIVAEYKLYTRVNIAADITRPASFQGFRTVELPRPAGSSPYTLERLNGQTFRVYLLRRVQLIPLQSGRLPLGIMGVQARISFVPAAKVGSSQQPATASDVTVIQQDLQSEAATVEVLALPHWSGADSAASVPVGHFSQQCRLLPDSGGAPLLLITYSGSGHWSGLPVPQIQWPDGVTAFEPTLEDKLDSQAVPISGQRIFGFRFGADTALSGGVLVKGLRYFDADSGRYVQLPDTMLPLQLAAPRPLAAEVLATEAALPATEWFTRYAPLLALAVAGSMLLALLLRRSMGRHHRRAPAQQPPAYESAVWQAGLPQRHRRPAPVASPAALALTNTDATLPQATAALQRQALLQLLQQKQWWNAATGITEKAASELPATLLQQTTDWLHHCQLACYSPLQQQADWGQLTADYEALMQALATV